MKTADKRVVCIFRKNKVKSDHDDKSIPTGNNL